MSANPYQSPSSIGNERRDSEEWQPKFKPLQPACVGFFSGGMLGGLVGMVQFWSVASLTEFAFSFGMQGSHLDVTAARLSGWQLGLVGGSLVGCSLGIAGSCIAFGSRQRFRRVASIAAASLGAIGGMVHGLFLIYSPGWPIWIVVGGVLGFLCFGLAGVALSRLLGFFV